MYPKITRKDRSSPAYKFMRPHCSILYPDPNGSPSRGGERAYIDSDQVSARLRRDFIPGNVSNLVSVLVTQALDVISPCNSDVQASREDMSL